MVVLLEGSPMSTEQHLSSIRVTFRCLFTSLTKAFLPQLPRLAWGPVLGRLLVVPNFFQVLRMMEATVLLGTFNAAEMFWYPSPDLCLNNPISELYREFL